MHKYKVTEQNLIKYHEVRFKKKLFYYWQIAAEVVNHTDETII